VIADIVFRSGTATYVDVLYHLQKCDSRFLPKLSSKVNLSDYANKIQEFAVIFEAWSGNKLIGLVAAYMNQERCGFVTNVSVVPDFLGQKIAYKLLVNCIEQAIVLGIKELVLEVSSNSIDAIRLYENNGFKTYCKNNDIITMKLELRDNKV